VRYYKLADEMALDLIAKLNPAIQDLKAKHLKILVEGFGFNERVLWNITKDFEKRLDLVYQFIDSKTELNPDLRKQFKEHIEKRWKGLFKNIGQN